MVWSKIAPIDNLPRYIRKESDRFVVLTKSLTRATENVIPKGWEVLTLQSGYLKIRRIMD